MIIESTFHVQYAAERNRLWVHSPMGFTVGRFDTRFGMDIHTDFDEMIKTGVQCLHCTHEKPTIEDFEFFIAKARELWGIEIDRSMLVI